LLWPEVRSLLGRPAALLFVFGFGFGIVTCWAQLLGQREEWLARPTIHAAPPPSSRRIGPHHVLARRAIELVRRRQPTPSATAARLPDQNSTTTSLPSSSRTVSAKRITR